MVCRFIRGATNLKPPVVHRYTTWDLSKDLHSLPGAPFQPLRSSGLQFLTFKVVFLVAVTLARWLSELAAFSLRKDLCIFHPDRVDLRLDPSFVPRVNSWFHRAQELAPPNFCPESGHALEKKWHTLDVRRLSAFVLKGLPPFRDRNHYLCPSSPLHSAGRSRHQQ